MTDGEFASLTITSPDFSVATYTALLGIIDARESVSNTRDRLRYYFLARGTQVDASTPQKSRILAGAVLE